MQEIFEGKSPSEAAGIGQRPQDSGFRRAVSPKGLADQPDTTAKLGAPDEIAIEHLIGKIKHYLITTSGRVIEESCKEEIYQVLCHALREEIMIHWTATNHTWAAKDCRMLYYFSMEYLPGRILTNNLANMSVYGLVKKVMEKLGRTVGEMIACEEDPGLGNGGLGRLASCFLDSLATQHYPSMGYGLRYQYGIFEQELRNGVQMERPDCWLLYENPWEFRKDRLACNIRFGGRTTGLYDTADYDEVRALPYDLPIVGFGNGKPFSVITLRLWSTKESPRNFELQRYNSGQLDQAAENTLLTDVLYPNDNNETGKRIRLKQEYMLVSASFQDILRHYLEFHPDLTLFADKVRIQINDTHPALVIAEMMWRLMKEHQYTFEKAWECATEVVGYTNHTILREALEEWNEARVKSLLPCHHAIIQEINQRLCSEARAKFPGDEDKIRHISIIESGQIRMAHLAISTAHKTNGVSKLHTELLKTRVFKDFNDLYPGRIISITNGVTQRRWLLGCNQALSDMITERIGPHWAMDFSEIAKLEPFASDATTQDQFWIAKHRNKQRLIDFMKKEPVLRDARGMPLQNFSTFDADWFFDVQIKRIHEYKRQLMNLLHTIMVYQELIENPASRSIKRAVIIAGKAAAGYEAAKRIIQVIYCVARTINKDPRTNNKLQIALIENYNVSRAEIIIPAAELSQQISLAGTEASGTGNMKLAMNGALTIGTPDGANIEMHEAIKDEAWPFCFGSSAEEIAALRDYEPWKILEAHPKIARVLDSFVNQTFAETPEEIEAFATVRRDLLEGLPGAPADRYFVLHDLPAYYIAQKKVEELYQDRSNWARLALLNIARMGPFSIDRTIQEYASSVWSLTACETDAVILDKVKEEYSEHDKCRIL